MIPESTYTDPLIATAIDNLESAHPAFMARPVVVRSILAALAHHAYQAGRTAAISELLTSEQAAALLDMNFRSISRLARIHNVGWNVGRDWLFRPEDIETLRAIRSARRPGRPRKTETD